MTESIMIYSNKETVKKKKLESFRRLPAETAKNLNEYTGQDILNIHAIVLKNIMWE